MLIAMIMHIQCFQSDQQTMVVTMMMHHILKEFLFTESIMSSVHNAEMLKVQTVGLS